LFDGELPALNIGSNNGESCARNVEQDVVEAARASPFESVVNGRFKGGNNVHALQLEIAQRTYMDENTRVFDTSLAGNLRETLRRMLTEFLRAAAS
jgi:N-formylglutamate amidohydrolase